MMSCDQNTILTRVSLSSSLPCATSPRLTGSESSTCSCLRLTARPPAGNEGMDQRAGGNNTHVAALQTSHLG